MTRNRVVALVALPILMALLASCQGSEFARSIQLVNDEREARGTPVVLNNSTLQAKAQQWAEMLASQGRLAHSNLADGVGPGWRTIGENLAMAGSIDRAHQLLMNSSGHRTTLLSSRYDSIGVGVASAGGRYYVVQVFAG